VRLDVADTGLHAAESLGDVRLEHVLDEVANISAEG